MNKKNYIGYFIIAIIFFVIGWYFKPIPKISYNTVVDGVVPSTYLFMEDTTKFDIDSLKHAINQYWKKKIATFQQNKVNIKDSSVISYIIKDSTVTHELTPNKDSANYTGRLYVVSADTTTGDSTISAHAEFRSRIPLDFGGKMLLKIIAKKLVYPDGDRDKIVILAGFNFTSFDYKFRTLLGLEYKFFNYRFFESSMEYELAFNPFTLGDFIHTFRTTVKLKL